MTTGLTGGQIGVRLGLVGAAGGYHQLPVGPVVFCPASDNLSAVSVGFLEKGPSQRGLPSFLFLPYLSCFSLLSVRYSLSIPIPLPFLLPPVFLFTTFLLSSTLSAAKWLPFPARGLRSTVSGAWGQSPGCNRNCVIF